MTEPHVIITRMQELLAEHPPQPRREVRCGYAILQWFKTLPKPNLNGGEVSDAEALSAALWGFPIILDPDLGRGTWALVEDGTEIARHMVGDGDRVWFVAGQFITTDDAAVADALDGKAALPVSGLGRPAIDRWAL